MNPFTPRFQQSTLELPETSSDPQQMLLNDAHLLLFPHAIRSAEADQFLSYCLSALKWRQDYLLIAGKRIPLPRLQSWYGDPGAHYRYSGLALEPLPWTLELLAAKQRIQTLTGQSFNSLLANHYRNGADSVGWHSDNEKELGERPVIASLSLGATRVFEMKHVGGRNRRIVRIPLTHGSVLLMAGNTQQFWRHQLPKDSNVTAPRVNLTFRTVSTATKMSLLS